MHGESVTGERIGPMVRRLRAAAGLSEDELATRLREGSGRFTLTRSEVWRWETEHEGRTPGPYWLPHLAAVLGVPEETLRTARAVTREKRRWGHVEVAKPAEVLARLLPPDEPLAPTGTTMGRRVGVGEADALLVRAHGLRLADDVLAGGDLVEPVLRELSRARQVFNSTCHTEEVGRRLLVGIAELAQLAGWVATDTGGKVDAEPLFRLGVHAARQAEDGPLEAHLLGSWGYWTANRGDTRRGLELVRAAEAAVDGSESLATRSLTSARLAWTGALAGDTQYALRMIGQAMEQIDEAEPGEDRGRRWLYWVNRPEQEVMEARVYTELHRPLRAVPLLRQVLGSYDAGHAREYALYASWLATALVDANEPEEAAAVARRVLELSASVPSSRAADRSKTMVAALRRHKQVPEVAQVLDMAVGL